ncbi:major facilitator superfamily domain-containing protein [Syncephalastrum racemosum]|uniref:Major facilitator superfamily domain-containing protein n=1 Tax=Syncephalastrum racemosum TaxID=13706 RepID=A0A1X2H1D0_SYNRA|nr:major facilitator superfamily domain-containing protein [Syncephalastrum racemosum]
MDLLLSEQPRKSDASSKIHSIDIDHHVASSASAEPYSLFSPGRKRLIVILASISAFFAPFSTNSYFPAMTKIEKDFGISTQQVNLTVTVFFIFQAISPTFWSSLADSRGRRPVYLSTLFVYILACLGLALTRGYSWLLIFRMLQAFGASSVIAVGAGTIADITEPAERGGYIGWYSLGYNIGPVLGPAIGGFLSQYLGWRWIFWLLAIVCGIHWCILGFWLPETLRLLVGRGDGYSNPTPQQWWRRRQQLKRQQQEQAAKDDDTCSAAPTVVPLLYMKEMDVLMHLTFYGMQYAASYAVTTTTPYFLARLYGLNESLIGVCYLASGLGCVLGSILQGKVLNINYRKMEKQYSLAISRLGFDDLPIESNRMRTMWFHAAVSNIILVLYGWCIHIKTHIGILLAIHFLLGFTSQAIFNAVQTLLVDLFPERSASITATNNAFRCVCGALSTTFILPCIEMLGAGWAFSLVSGILLLGRIPLYLCLKMGPKYRRKRVERLNDNDL